MWGSGSGFANGWGSSSGFGFASSEAAVPFSPDGVAGLVAWKKFATEQYEDQAKTTPATGTDPVGAWGDSSGNGNDIVIGTADARPVLSGGDVVFDGTDDRLSTAGMMTLKPATLFCLVNFANLTGNRRIWGGTDTGLGIDTNGTALRLMKTNSALIATSSAAMSTGSWIRIIVTYSAAGVYAFYVNGSAAGTGTNDQVIAGVRTFMSGESGTAPLFASVREAGIYDNVISAGDITALDTYLAAL